MSPARGSRPKATRRSRQGSPVRTVLTLLGIVLWVPVVMGLVLYYLWAEVPYRGYDGDKILVEVPHRSAQDILSLLQEKGVLRSGSFGRLYLILTRRGGKLRAGEYLFEGPLTARQVLDKIARGDVYYHRVTIPEGLRSGQIFALFIEEGFGTQEEFRNEFLQTSRIQDLDPEATDLEGYLYPDTYALVRGTSAREIVDQMVLSHRLRWEESWKEAARTSGLSIRQLVTLASLIEKETARPEERGLVASVFHNRLREGMKLQCDPTIIFALVMRDRYKGKITRSDLRLDSRYNTYAYAGLPPGPIANPGKDSLKAAVFPDSTGYLYFVSMNNGQHVFSATLAEHNQAVERYQR
ncbi:MAG TPA: endolytic transglycosylase MltG [Candidatus Polarisedimenticolia bacterium]|nr:endolytic transglycosylase MltG [Candidatus Polarisedimenticolia bacterium]